MRNYNPLQIILRFANNLSFNPYQLWLQLIEQYYNCNWLFLVETEHNYKATHM